MTKGTKLAARFKEVILDGTWIANTNYKDQLTGTTWEKANQKFGSLNTLAGIVFHINYYTAGIVQVFDGGKLTIQDKFSFDAPAINSQVDWDTRLNNLWVNAERFSQHVALMSDSQLQEDFVDAKYGSYQRNIEGAIEHSYYHLGQVSLIKKLIQS